MNRLRHLQFDDFLTLDGLLRGLTLTQVAAELSLTQPALSHRLKKMEFVFGTPLVEKRGRKILLTSIGMQVARKASQAMTIFSHAKKSDGPVEIKLGARLDITIDWLFPALFQKKKSHFKIHLYQGTGDDVMHLLQRGVLDAVVTSAPVVAQSLRQVVLRDEHYFLCAAPYVAKKIRHLRDLAACCLIEHDTTFPFRRYWPEALRAAEFHDVLFLGSTQVMAMGLVAGLGVGVIPDFVALPFFKTKKLVPVLQKYQLTQDTFRLVYSEMSPLRDHMEKLSQMLADT